MFYLNVGSSMWDNYLVFECFLVFRFWSIEALGGYEKVLGFE